MLRRLIIPLLALALPFIVYWVYQKLERRRTQAGQDPWPFAILWLTGLVLAVETLFAAALSEPRTQGRYVPAALQESGEVSPARIEPQGPEQ